MCLTSTCSAASWTSSRRSSLSSPASSAALEAPGCLGEVALLEADGLARRDLEHPRLAVVRADERTVAHLELPLSPVLRQPGVRQAPQLRVVGYTARFALDDDVEASFVGVVADRQQHVRVV